MKGKPFPKLTYLSLKDFAFSNETFQYLTTACPSLEELEVAVNEEFTQFHLNLPNLKRLKVLIYSPDTEPMDPLNREKKKGKNNNNNNNNNNNTPELQCPKLEHLDIECASVRVPSPRWLALFAASSHCPSLAAIRFIQWYDFCASLCCVLIFHSFSKSFASEVVYDTLREKLQAIIHPKDVPNTTPWESLKSIEVNCQDPNIVNGLAFHLICSEGVQVENLTVKTPDSHSCCSRLGPFLPSVKKYDYLSSFCFPPHSLTPFISS